MKPGGGGGGSMMGGGGGGAGGKMPPHASTGLHMPTHGGGNAGGGGGNGGILHGPQVIPAPNCPNNMVFVPGVVSPTTKTTYDACVDQYEAYVVQINSDGSESAWPFNSVPTPGVTLAARVSPNVKPQAYMSGDASKAACVAAGKRLCRLEEWLAACQGPHKYTFPYGNTLQAGICNVGRKTNPVIDVFGSKAKFDGVQMNDPRLDLLPNSVANTGAFSQCVSGYEAYDMHGNLDEWVDHINQPSGHGSFSGGFFVDGSINGPGCLYRTTAHVTSWHDYSLGFRCCQDASD